MGSDHDTNSLIIDHLNALDAEIEAETIHVEPKQQLPVAEPEIITTTYSMWSSFRNCRRACQYRYIDWLRPVETAHSLRFGDVIHQCLERWHRRRDMREVLAFIDHAFPDRHSNEHEKADWHLARAMMMGYADRYAVEGFSVFALEVPFEGSIVNPATGASSRTFRLAGKVDGIVMDEEGLYWILEHKTASLIDSGYLERLWMDFQIQLYAHYVSTLFDIPVAGIIYNVLGKAKLKQRQGETEEQFEVRRAELIAKSKSGKSSAKRREAESDEDFAARLAEWYAQPDAFHREVLYVGQDQYDSLLGELWELTQSYLDARRRGCWYQNTSQCFQWGRQCSYFPLCRSQNNPVIRDTHYRRVAPNEELVAAEQQPDLLEF